ncbi:MAG: family 1 glycosylhydrolase, partial [Candidatus Omnitrophica bacterium]|nr:family 1 glycosylhydrolase [Candidatus Omnitrophota bacterium]
MPQFPQNFLWGAATSAYQVEGNNIYSDWWEWERRIGLKEVSKEACRHYDLYKQDFDLAKNLNHNAHRLSIEWSRVEPRKDKFLDKEIDHYLEVVRCLREYGMEPIITLHHFTNPFWFAQCGGWQEKFAIDYFLDYVKRLVEALAKTVRYWITFNEPLVYVYHAYILGLWPPQEKSILKAMRVIENLICAHLKSYKLIHKIYKQKKLSSPYVSIAKNMQYFMPCQPTLRNRLAVYLRD